MRRVLMILLITLGFSFCTLVLAKTYKSVDEKGTVHFAEDPGTIPEKNMEKPQGGATETIFANASGQPQEDERITYYYRDPRPHKLIPILESILGDKDTTSSSKTIKPLMHFFATALQKDLDKIKDLEDLQPNYSGQAARLLHELIKEAKDYHPASLKFPEDLELLWSEYKASGDKQIIERLISVIAATTPSKANNLQGPVTQFLIKIAPCHFEVFRMLRKRPESSIGEIVSIIRHSASDPAYEHLSRGVDLYDENKNDEAMQEYNKSLSYVPDYWGTYTNISKIYARQNKMREAIKAGKKAVSIEPNNSTAHYNLALHYEKLKEQDEAIKWYKKCLESDPKEIDCHYRLGSAYKSRRDNVKAAIHLRKYLEYAPDGTYADSVKQILASIGQKVKEDPTDISIMLQNKRYDALEEHFLSLLRGRNKDKEGFSQLSLAYGRLCDRRNIDSYVRRITQLKEWLTHYHSSHFANACLGMAYKSYAWYARGGGYANTVSEEGWRLFKERLLTAKEYLEKAYSLDQSDPNVPAGLVTVALGLCLERNEMEKQFQRAILADSSDHQAYYNKLLYLMPKWHGSKEEMFLFARESVRKAPPKSRIPMVLPAAHWEMYDGSGTRASYFRNSNVWKEMKEAYQTVTKSFPEAKRTHNWFARTAYMAGDYPVARKEVEMIGDDWDRTVWGNKNAFEEIKAELLAK